MRDYASLVARLALGLSFLHAIADRFGLLGPPGFHNVSWGDFSHFIANVGQLNWFLPKAVIPPLAWVETIVECSLGILLCLGLFLRFASYAGALLLLSFTITMGLAGGAGLPIAYSVPIDCAAAFLLGAVGSARWSLDAASMRLFRLRTSR
jgi:putative oxidoreductase